MPSKNEESIDQYINEIIAGVPEENRPDPAVACRQGCPKANWMREDLDLRCYCHSMGVNTWPRTRLNDCLDRRRAIEAER